MFGEKFGWRVLAEGEENISSQTFLPNILPKYLPNSHYCLTKLHEFPPKPPKLGETTPLHFTPKKNTTTKTMNFYESY